MKLVVLVFILAELLDILLTFMGLRLGFPELNPLGNNMVRLVMLKVVVIICVSILLQRMDFGKLKKFVWGIPVIAGVPALFNLLLIIGA